jgi:glycosyltransferase involved in cell wall biosynthesis
VAIKYDKNKVSIIIPAKNEGEGLLKILRSIKPYGSEIIVVDGHSTDNTRHITKVFGAKYILDNGIGRGDGVRIGINKAKNPYLLFFDADGSHNPKEIPSLLIPLFKNEADVVIGSRRTGGSFDLNMDFWGIARSGGADFLAYLVNKRFNTGYSDILFSFRAIKKSVAKKLDLAANGFEIEEELVVKTLKKGYRLKEVPTRENARKWGKSKLHTITGIKFVFYLIKELYF